MEIFAQIDYKQGTDFCLANPKPSLGRGFETDCGIPNGYQNKNRPGIKIGLLLSNDTRVVIDRSFNHTRVIEKRLCILFFSHKSPE